MTEVNFDGVTEWLGGPPDLDGRVVLVNFWTRTPETRPGTAWCCGRGGYTT